MNLLEKFFKVANVTIDKIWNQNINRHLIQINPQFIESEEIISKYNESNERMEQIRKSIQNNYSS
ncbi:hypothetical protein ACJDU8_11710 [Clostridium sp. WILCCON 0269]|uniref:Uncharacterized protein n=1 Tax=Candidatus Clostridium eludens TaxID=3381663 RepID=A0ABW8SM11_9CLOT